MQKYHVLIYLFSYISILRCDKNKNGTTRIKLSEYVFPFDFEFGAATSAYQSDGAWNMHGKVESIWDSFVHRHPEKIIDNSTGDVACNSYNLCSADIQLAKELGLNYYHFSIAWTRLFLDNATNINACNHYGLLYYNDILDTLLRSQINPRVTMYYWDLPQKLEDQGGWTNPEIITYFVKYAKSLFENFGEKVKIWTTFSRPFQICKFGYGLGIHAPGTQRSGIDDYRCTRNVLLAHAEVYRLYETKYKLNQKGEIGISLDTFWYQPATTSLADQAAATRAFEFHLGMFANPIFGTGDYPKLVRKIINSRGLRKHNLPRLPGFTAEEIKKIKGSADFFGLSYFSIVRVANRNYEREIKTWDADSGVKISCNTIRCDSVFERVKGNSYGLRQILINIKEAYNVSKIYITENGYPDSGELADYDRANYILLHLSETIKALYDDEVPIKSYTIWSLIDQFEWNSGYTIKYGLFSVNFSDIKRRRDIKLSSKIYTSIIKEKQLPRTTLDRNSSHKYSRKSVLFNTLTILFICAYK